jgi:hypothetical protein
MIARHNTRAVATALLVSGAVALGALATAGPAGAEKPKTNFEAFSACVSQTRARGETAQAAAFDCCIIYDGVWQGVYPQGYCAWPAGNMDYPPGSTSTRPTPGSVTVILPPDATKLAQ